MLPADLGNSCYVAQIVACTYWQCNLSTM